MTLTFLFSKGEYTTCALHSTQYFTCVQPPGVRVATTAVHKHIGLHPPLSGLLWHVLNEVQPLLKPVMDLSMAISRPRLYAALKLSSKGSMNGLNLYSLFNSARLCVFFSPMLKPFRSETALWCQYTAERSG